MAKQIVWPKEGVKPCPECGKGTMVVRVNRKTGAFFVGCSRYPACKWARKTSYGLDCGGCSRPIPLDPEKCARVLYDVELSELRTGEVIVEPTHTPPPSSPIYADEDPWRDDDDVPDDDRVPQGLTPGEEAAP